jgi:hypothetical protein
MDEDYPRTLLELENRFATDEACWEYLRALRCPEGFICHIPKSTSNADGNASIINGNDVEYACAGTAKEGVEGFEIHRGEDDAVSNG